MKVNKIKTFTILLFLLITSTGYCQETYKDILETTNVAIDIEIYDDIEIGYHKLYNNQ